MTQRFYNGLKTLRRVLVCVLLLALAVLLVAGLTRFSADTFARHGYDVFFAVSGKASQHTVITLNGDDESLVAGYKDSVVRITRNVVDVYGPTLLPYASHSVILRDPRFCAADDSFVVYDLGGTYAYVFDSFKCLSTITAPGTLYGAACASDGRFCLLCGGTETRGSVTVYPRTGSGKTVTRTFSDTYVFSAAFSGDVLYVVGYRPSGPTTDTVVYTLDPATGLDTVAPTVIEDRMPLRVGALRGGAVSVACTYGIYTVNDGAAREVFSYGTVVPVRLALSEEMVAVETTEGHLSVLDRHGTLLYERQLDAVVDVSAEDGQVCVLTTGLVTVLDSAGNTVREMPTGSLVRHVILTPGKLFSVSSHDVVQTPFD